MEQIESENETNPPLPERGTAASVEYFWASACDARLFHFVIDTVITGDYVRFVASRALDGKTDYKEVTPSELAVKNPGPRTIALRKSSQELLEMFLGRIVDNFQVYIVDIIRTVLHKQPRILSARKQELALEYILQFDSIETLTRDIIEGKVSALSYEGFGELEEWCQSKGIPLVVPDGKRSQIVELIATRNLIVHNRGIVDARYKKTVPSSALAIGETRLLGVDDLFDAVKLLDTVVKITDIAIAGKFDLSQQNIRKAIQKRSSDRWPQPEKKENSEADEPKK